MKITVFCKERNGKDNNKFLSYISKLTKKTGEEVTVQLKFSEECGKIKKDSCPCIIDVEVSDCSYSERKVIKDDREIINRVLWINKYTKTDDVFVDTSASCFM